MDRRDLEKELNRINELYQQKDLELRKIGGSTEQRQAMRDMLNKKKQDVIDQMGDSLQQLNAGKEMNIKGGTISKGINQSGLPDMAKEVGLGKFKKLFGTVGKKAAGIIPLAGAGIAALQGDPAMAAEELLEDAAGPLAALKPDTAGDVRGQNELEAEIQARKNYRKSPAYRDARGITEEDQDIEELQKPKKAKFSGLRSMIGL